MESEGSPRPKMTARFAGAIVLGIVVGGIALWFARLPMWHSDIWGHLSYGRFIIQNAELPETEPFMPLAADAKVVDTAWLSQVLGYLAADWFDVAALQIGYAMCVAVCAGILGTLFLRESGSVFASVAGLAVWLAVNWQQLLIIRPQIFGQMAFCLLIAVVFSQRDGAKPRRSLYLITMPLLFAAWANLHGSFPVGLALLGCCVVGRAVEVESPGEDEKFKLLLLGCVLSAAAILLNPYGVGLYRVVVGFSRTENLADLVEWQSLTLMSKQGRAFIAASVVFLSCLVVRRRSMWPELYAMLLFSVLAFWRSRMIHWWAPVVAWAVVRQLSVPQTERNARRSSTAVETVCVAISLLVTMGVARFQQPRDLLSITSSRTPLGAAEFLAEQERGVLFHSYEFGDYLAWNGLDPVRPFVTSHVHLIPRQVWLDYRAMSQAHAGWEERLADYRVDTVLLNPRQHAKLASALDESDQWRLAQSHARWKLWFREADNDSTPAGTNERETL